MDNRCKFYTLYSGSGGNCSYIRVGESAILIDAGKSARALCRSLEAIGESIETVNAIFITHEHTDHISALSTLAKKYKIAVHMTEQSAYIYDAVPDCAVNAVLCKHPPIYTEAVGCMTVSSFETSHDSHMSVGYRVEFELDGVRHAIGLATDTGYVTDGMRQGLLGCEGVILESNHDIEMLQNGSYPRELKRRISARRGHLSNDDCACFAAELAASGTRGILLAHISRENNEPELAFDATQNAVFGTGAVVGVAHPCEPVELIMGGCLC